MSINKSSSIEEICDFLRNIEGLKITENQISKFRAEKIKGNEIFYLKDEDLEKLGIKFNKKECLKKKINELKNSENIKNILTYTEKIYTDSNVEEVKNFLKKEILLEENIIEKFVDINGNKFKELKEEDLESIGIKLGEKRKILNYIPSISPKPKTNEIIDNISKDSTVEETCLLLEQKLNLSKEIIDEFHNNQINGEEFLKLTREDLEDCLNVGDKETQNKILNYINTRN